MSNAPFETAAVIGTGMMGPGIACTLALGGVRTTILSRSDETAAKGLAEARRQVQLLSDNGLADPARAALAIELLAPSSAFDAIVTQGDLVIESAPQPMRSTPNPSARID